MNNKLFDLYSCRTVSNILEINDELNFLKNKVFIVWRSGGLSQNNIRNRQPKTYIQLREVHSTNYKVKNSNRKYIKVNCQDHGLFRTGTIWEFDEYGNANAILKRKYSKETFEVDFSQDGWSYFSLDDDPFHDSLIPSNHYQSDYEFDKYSKNNWMISFNLSSGEKLLIPCMELFTRTYGLSSKLRRDLLTLTFDNLEKNLYPPYDISLKVVGAWNIKLARYIRKGDGIFLAFMKYDSYVKSIVKNINSQLQINKKNDPCFLKIPPWFQGIGKITVAGTRLKENGNFLAARIEAIRFPSTKQRINIILDKDKYFNDDGIIADKKTRHKKKKHFTTPDSFNEEPPLSQGHDSDYNSSSTIITTDAMEWSNIPKTTFVENKKDKQNIDEVVRGDDNKDKISTDDPHGEDSNTGQAEILTTVVIESEGTIYDTWNALRQCAKQNPKTITSVESYLGDNCFSNNSKATLILLPELPEGKYDSIWNYTIPTSKRRGILFIKVTTNTNIKTFYVVEISRIIDSEGSDLGDSYSGLLFCLDKKKLAGDKLKFDKLVKDIQLNIMQTKGVFKHSYEKIVPKKGIKFSHRSGNPEEMNYAAENIALLIFNKMNIDPNDNNDTNTK